MKKIPKISQNKKQIADKNKLIATSVFNNKLRMLKSAMSESINKEALNIDCDDIEEDTQYTIFISLSDGKSRARVCHTSDADYDNAWKKVAKLANDLVDRYKIKPVWVKADIVDVVQKVKFRDVKTAFLSLKYEKFFRKGVSLDSKMKMAFLESEANSYKLYDYTMLPSSKWKEGDDLVPWFNVKQAVQYLEWNDKKDFPFLEPNAYFFDCRSFFLDTDGKVYELYKYGTNCGRRIQDEVDGDFVKNILTTSSQYLTRQLNADGRYIYGYFPSFNSVMKSYNILRHAGTTWSLMCAYDVTKDGSLVPTINRTIDYLISQIRYKDDETAFLLEEKSQEFKLGGIGIAILTLSKYMETFGDKDYSDIIRKLANGIISLQDPNSGKLTHVLNAVDFSVKEAFRTVYYDGESSYALTKAYEITGDIEYLNAARLSIDYFIEKNYIQYRDHWLAYAMNAFTMHVKEEKYITFALKNAWENLDKIYNQPTSYHTYLELLMETYDLYLRLKEGGCEIEYFRSIDESRIIDTIKHRAWHMLDGYFYPEYAMYMSKPDSIVGSFFVRHDGFRDRIDDNQHFIDGYAKYYKIMCNRNVN
ncbi:MAG: hypothetical protein MJ133_09180 [Lachnospiraceae bacterium]|nr:hypothetical protein [Lachnospiraceae bacterium]